MFQPLTLDQLVDVVHCSPVRAVTWLKPLNKAMARWHINTRLRQAGFLAQIAHESQRLTVFVENLNYSADGLANTWPTRYAVDPRAPIRRPNALALRLHRNPELIANTTYANRMGNGTPESGDGWRYRGRGPKQLTGKQNYVAYTLAADVDVLTNPDQLLLPEIGADSAGWFWHTNGCSELMDAGDYRRVTLAINGGLVGYEDGNSIGFDDRVELFEHARSVLKTA